MNLFEKVISCARKRYAAKDGHVLFRQDDRAQIQEKGELVTFCDYQLYAMKLNCPFQVEGSLSTYIAGDYVIYSPSDSAVFGLKAKTFETYAKDMA